MQRLKFRLSSLICLCVAVAYGQTSQEQAVPQTFTVSGDIQARLVLGAEDLARMPREKVLVPEQDGTKVEYEGVPLS